MKAKKTSLACTAPSVIGLLVLLLAQTEAASSPTEGTFPTQATVTLEVEELTDFLSYKTSPLTHITKIHVTCNQHGDDGGRSAERVLYEDLWYRGNDFIGCKRFREFPIKQDQLVDAQVVFSDKHFTADPSGAAAEASARILLDCLMNRDTLSVVQVPADRYFNIIDQLDAIHFEPYYRVWNMVSANIPMTVHASDGHQQTLLYSETRYDAN